MSRKDCLEWWKERYDRPLERSACVGCPFQSRQRWMETKRRWPKLFAEAVDIDANMRGKTGLRQGALPASSTGAPRARRCSLDDADPGNGRAASVTGSETSARGTVGCKGQHSRRDGGEAIFESPRRFTAQARRALRQKQRRSGP